MQNESTNDLLATADIKDILMVSLNYPTMRSNLDQDLGFIWRWAIIGRAFLPFDPCYIESPDAIFKIFLWSLTWEMHIIWQKINLRERKYLSFGQIIQASWKQDNSAFFKEIEKKVVGLFFFLTTS